MIIDSLCLTYFTQHNLFQSRPCWYKSWVFILSDGGIIPHSIYGPYLYPFVRWRASCFFPQFGDCGHCCYEHWGTYIPSFRYICISGVKVLQFLGLRVTLFLIFWGISTLFSKVAVPTCIPSNSVRGFPFLYTSSPTFVVSCPVKFGHSDWCKVVSQCGFDLNLPDG